MFLKILESLTDFRSFFTRGNKVASLKPPGVKPCTTSESSNNAKYTRIILFIIDMVSNVRSIVN